MSESLLFAALVVGAPALKERPDEGNLLGDWVLETFTVSATTVPPGVQPPSYVFAPDGRYYHRSGETGELVLVATYTVDRTARPMAIDWHPEPGQPGARRVKGIFKVQGDKLLLCLAPTPAAPRPTAFESPKGSLDVLNVFKRSGKK
jgi:uncharacterized protein (TIGR03067 family)